MRPLLLILLLLSGCASEDKFVSYVASERARLPALTHVTGISNGRRTPADRIALIIAKPYPELRSGEIAVRIDGVNAWVAHPLAYQEGPLWRMWGANGLTNPVADSRRLTPDNYLGILVDPVTKEPL